jgi:hypothetical protein
VNFQLSIFAGLMDLKSFWEKLTNWELWPFKLRYLAITPVWMWYCLRSGSLWFFSSSNPTITFGGFEGEGKKEMYDQLPESLYPKTVYVQPGESSETLLKKIAEHGFTYPFCVKPDVGMKGLLFRKVDQEKDLLYYHQNIQVEYIIQDLALYPIEISVFYYRFPDQQMGVITGFIQKELMEVIGDGKSKLIELIQEHPKAKYRLDEMRVKHADNLHFVLPKGEKYFLTYAANLNRGARFVNLKHEIDENLHRVFDELSLKTNFYYGRYDIKCKSVDDLKQGKNYIILEFNGSGAEPNHVYNTGYSLFRAYKEILKHWKVLFLISRYNHRNGVPYWSFRKGWKFLQQSKKHFQILEELDTKILI